MKNTLPEYIVPTIKQHGNTVISLKIYKELGDCKIIEELNRAGLNCKITVLNGKALDMVGNDTHKHRTTVLIEELE